MKTVEFEFHKIIRCAYLNGHMFSYRKHSGFIDKTIEDAIIELTHESIPIQEIIRDSFVTGYNHFLNSECHGSIDEDANIQIEYILKRVLLKYTLGEIEEYLKNTNIEGSK